MKSRVLGNEKLISGLLSCIVVFNSSKIQASIAQTSRRQLEALGKKRTSGKATTGVVYMRRSLENTRSLRGRRSRKSCEVQEEEEEEEEEEEYENEEDAAGKDSSSGGGDEEVRPKRHKRWGGVSSADEVETTAREILAWGRGGIRSHTRHGSLTSTVAAKTARNTRVSNLMDHLRKLPQTNHKLDIHLKLISLDEQSLPNMQHLDLCCSSTMLITHLIQYLALDKSLQDDEIELLLVKGDNFELLNCSVSIQVPVGEKTEPVVINPLTEELHLHQTVLDIAESSAQKDLTFAYRKKSSSS